MNSIEFGKTKGTGKLREIGGFEKIRGINEDVESVERSMAIEEIERMIKNENLQLPELPSEAEMRKASRTLSANKEDELWLSRETRGVLKRVGTIKKWTGSQR